MVLLFWLIGHVVMASGTGESFLKGDDGRTAGKNLYIVGLGDSLTKGTGDPEKRGGYLRFLKERLYSLDHVQSIKVANYGKKGLHSGQLFEVVSQYEKSFEKADLIIISIGGNDILKTVRDHFFSLSYSLFEEEQLKFSLRIAKLIDDIRSINNEAFIIFVGLYNPFSNVRTFPEIKHVIQLWNEGLKSVISGYEHTKFVEISDLFEACENLLHVDRFHPNGYGYALIARRIFYTLIGDESILLGSRER